MESEEAINNLNFIIVTDVYDNEVRIDKTKIVNEYNESVGIVLQHLTKQEKMIELMSRFIDTELSSEHLSKVLKIDVKPLETYREDIKQYFKKKAEEAE